MCCTKSHSGSGIPGPFAVLGMALIGLLFLVKKAAPVIVVVTALAIKYHSGAVMFPYSRMGKRPKYTRGVRSAFRCTLTAIATGMVIDWSVTAVAVITVVGSVAVAARINRRRIAKRIAERNQSIRVTATVNRPYQRAIPAQNKSESVWRVYNAGKVNR